MRGLYQVTGKMTIRGSHLVTGKTMIRGSYLFTGRWLWEAHTKLLVRDDQMFTSSSWKDDDQRFIYVYWKMTIRGWRLVCGRMTVRGSHLVTGRITMRDLHLVTGRMIFREPHLIAWKHGDQRSVSTCVQGWRSHDRICMPGSLSTWWPALRDWRWLIKCCNLNWLTLVRSLRLALR